MIVEAAIRPFPIIGLGVQAFGNLNTTASFVGVLLSLHVGWMPPR